MKNYKQRRFIPGECMHIYQRSINGFNVFYDVEDYLVFYTIFSVLSRIYQVSILELCLMRDHLHSLIVAQSLSEISAFIRHYSSLFVMEFNNHVGRHGQFFHKSYGSAPKKGSKKIRSAIIYIGNNPVEKGLCVHASEYRWNFLAYLEDRNPFSQYRPYNSLGSKLRKSLKLIRQEAGKNKYLNYSMLGLLFDGLSHDEQEYLIDYIITSYWPFDNESLLSYYDNVEDMFIAMKSTAGNEYDIKEKFYSGSDRIYDEMIRVVRENAGIVPVRRVTVLKDDLKLEIAGMLHQMTTASKFQLSKFLHWEGGV